jgi:hypothetical protein
MSNALAVRPRWMLSVAMLAVTFLTTGAAAQSARKPLFELDGLVKRDGDDSYALLKEPEITAGASVLVRQGESVGRYRLVAVEEDRVLLQSPDQEVIVVKLGGAPGSPAAPSMTAEQSVDAALKGTRGGKALDMIKKALGLGAHP